MAKAFAALDRLENLKKKHVTMKQDIINAKREKEAEISKKV